MSRPKGEDDGDDEVGGVETPRGNAKGVVDGVDGVEGVLLLCHSTTLALKPRGLLFGVNDKVNRPDVLGRIPAFLYRQRD